MGVKTIHVTALTDTLTSGETALAAEEIQGSIRSDEQGNLYRFVKNASTDAFAAGYAVCYNGTTRTEVITPATANFGNLAGVAISAIPVAGYGWIQVKGKATGILAASVVQAVNTNLIPVNAAYTLAAGAASNASAASGYQRCHFCHSASVDSVSVTTTATIALDCEL